MIVNTKFYPPEFDEHWVTRKVALDKLQRLRRPLLTIVQAPGGYGKSTFVAQWLESTGGPFAWLSLDKFDDDPFTFWSYLTHALNNCNSKIGGSALPWFNLGDNLDIDSVIKQLSNDLLALVQGDGSGKSPIPCLILDDFHHIQNKTILSQFELFLNYCPATFRIIISTRIYPDIDLARLRAHGRVNEIDFADLHFSSEESNVFLLKNSIVSLSQSEMDFLHTKTEGWIAGLQMAVMSLQNVGKDSEENRNIISSLAKNDRNISDYLFHEVLDHLPTHLRRFLVEIAFLPRFCASLCNAVSSISNSHLLLKELRKRSVFTIALDDCGEWFRLHDLFRQKLIEFFDSLPESKTFELKNSAFEWFEEKKHFHDAIELSLELNFWDRAKLLIFEIEEQLKSDYQRQAVARWLDKMPVDYVLKSPKLIMLRVWSTLSEHRNDQLADQIANVVAHLEDVGLASDTNTVPVVKTSELKNLDLSSGQEFWQTLFELYHLQERILVNRGHFDKAEGIYEKFEKLAAGVDHRYHTIAVSGPIKLSLIKGNVHRAYEHVGRTLDLVREAPQDFRLEELLGGYMYANFCFQQMGEMNQCVANYRDIKSILEKSIWGNTPLSQLSGICVLDIYRETNKLDTATAIYKGLENLFNSNPQRLSNQEIVGRLLYCRVLISKNDLLEAERQLALVLELLGQTQLIWISPYESPQALGVMISYLKGDIQGALAKRQHIRLDHPADQIVYLKTLYLEKRWQDCHDNILRMRAQAQADGRQLHLIQIKFLESLVFFGQSHQLLAVKSLNEAMDMASLEGIVRMFIDDGPNFCRLPELLRLSMESSSDLGFCRLLLDTWNSSYQSNCHDEFEDRAISDAFTHLSKREHEILDLISEGHTNAKIADLLFVSSGTVKWHTSNIFKKLNVKNRSQLFVLLRETERSATIVN